ncbi:MAG: hypothetical protein PHO08_03235 [Methylococcales bacterium]|nr:hypothetical protein [Methylococcales bacterium]MDD5632459.1 hypothetical protein [Methylococcales bacterium]
MIFKTKLSSLSKSKSLKAQIRDAEQKILIRQRGVGVRATLLIKKIHQEMTAPSTLLLAGGVGFIIGELTRRQTTNSFGISNNQQSTGEITPLKTALNLITLIHSLYIALPLTWKVKFSHQLRASGRQAPERQN